MDFIRKKTKLTELSENMQSKSMNIDSEPVLSGYRQRKRW